MERMVRTGVSVGGREPTCGISAHGVWDALGAQRSGGFGTVWGGCRDGRERILDFLAFLS